MLFSVGQHTIIAVFAMLSHETVGQHQHQSIDCSIVPTQEIRIVGIPPFLRLCHIRPQLWEWDNSQKSAYFSSCPTVFGFVAADSSPSARASPVFFVFTAPFDAASESGAPGTASSPATVAAPSLSECAFAADDSAGAAATSAAPYTGTDGAGATEDPGTKSQGMRWANTAKRNRITKP